MGVGCDNMSLIIIDFREGVKQVIAKQQENLNPNIIVGPGLQK